MKRSTRLAGHGLRNEGRLWNGLDYRSGIVGPGICECGEKSGDLPNAAQRKRWHREHKESVRAAEQLGRGVIE